MSRKRLYWILGLVLLLAAPAIFGVSYLYNAVWYNFPGITDHEIFPHRVVEASNAPLLYPKQANKDLNIRLKEKLELLETVAFIIFQDDTIRHEQYWDGYDESKRVNSFSVAKSVVSLAVGIAIKEGAIKSLDQAVGDFIPSFNSGKKAAITVRHLLTMTSGLDWNESYYNPFSNSAATYYGADLEQEIYGLEMKVAAGTEFEYKSGDTQLLSFVLKHATGMSLSDYVSKHIWQKIGTANTAYWSLDHEGGDEKAFCCMGIAPMDYVRLGTAFLKEYQGTAVLALSEGYMEQLGTKIGLKDKFDDEVDYYGLSWWLTTSQGKKVIYARGILGQYIFVIPEANMVVVRLGHHRGEKDYYHPIEVPIILSEALDHVKKGGLR